MRKAFRWVNDRFTIETYRLLQHDHELHTELDYPYQVEAYFEEVGFLVNKNIVDIDVIVDRLAAMIISHWKKLEPWILEVRKERGYKTFGEHFQMLYEKTLRYMKK